MVAFNPISPAEARQLVGGASIDHASAILADFVEAGLIRAYARVIETLSVGGGRAEVREARIPRDLWRRVLAEGKIDDVWATGTVRLEGDGMVGGKPAAIITGIRFNKSAVQDAADKHVVGMTPGGTEVAPSPVAPVAPTTPARSAPISDSEEQISPSTAEALDAFEIAPVKVRRGLAADVLAVSIQDAMEITDLGRTTLYKLRDKKKLIMNKVGGRTMVDADSIRKLLGAKLQAGPTGAGPEAD